MLYLVATPIGDYDELSPRALKILVDSPVIICESTKETARLLRHFQVSGKKYELLNEHSTQEDIQRLLEICRTQDVALVSDCGTPGFCDPGPSLIHLCRKEKIPVRSVLGPSSLMGLLSLSSLRLDQFVFRGFLSAETEQRKRELVELQKEQRAIVLMDTPYRLQKTLQDMQDYFPKRKLLLCMNLSQPEEQIIEGSVHEIQRDLVQAKAEFMLLIYPEKYQLGR